MWIGEPLQRLRTLAALADAVVDLAGAQLISALDAFTMHGEPGASGTVSQCPAAFSNLRNYGLVVPCIARTLDTVLCS